MSMSTGAAIKALLESANLGVPVYRDRQPENERLPYIVVHEAISIIPEPAFNQLDDPDHHISEQVQIDLWERWKDANSLTESYTLGEHVALALTAAQFADPPSPVTAVRLLSGPDRLIEVEENLVHKIYQVQIRRTLISQGS